MNVIEIKQKLKNGICEITVVDEHSVENKLSATLSTNHLPDYDSTNIELKGDIQIFNVAKEEWQMINILSIIDIEQLTGNGSLSNKNKLQSSQEYLHENV